MQGNNDNLWNSESNYSNGCCIDTQNYTRHQTHRYNTISHKLDVHLGRQGL